MSNDVKNHKIQKSVELSKRKWQISVVIVKLSKKIELRRFSYSERFCITFC